MKKSSKTQPIIEMGLFVAIAIVIDAIASLYSPFKYGGSISFAMLLIFIIAIRHGWKAGVLSGFAFGILQALVAVGLGTLYVVGAIQFILDYVVAFMVLGVAGLFKNSQTKVLPFVLGITLGSFLRYLAHGFSGVIFFWMFAPAGVNVWFYSFILYNLPYMAASYALSLVIGLILQRRGLISYQQQKEEN
jgi:thiamine transporter